MEEIIQSEAPICPFGSPPTVGLGEKVGNESDMYAQAGDGARVV